MLSAIKPNFFFPWMHRDITGYLIKFIECQQVKVEHQYPIGLPQPIPMAKLKWEVITLDFITGLPGSKRSNDSIMVIVDNLSKVARFIPVKSTFKVVHIVDIFMKEVF